MENMALPIMTALLVKHYFFDFHWQPPFMWQNKGTFGHWGGIVHSGLHAFVTWLLLVFLAPIPLWYLALIALAEFVVHYLTDWAKMNINKKMGWTATTHNEFWQLTGLDQLVHQLTYIFITFAVIGY